MRGRRQDRNHLVTAVVLVSLVGCFNASSPISPLAHTVKCCSTPVPNILRADLPSGPLTLVYNGKGWTGSFQIEQRTCVLMIACAGDSINAWVVAPVLDSPSGAGLPLPQPAAQESTERDLTFRDIVFLVDGKGDECGTVDEIKVKW